MNYQQALQQIKQACSTKQLTSQNPYDEQHEFSKRKDYYEQAQAHMQGKSYLERRLIWFKLSKRFRSFYHPVSVILALITATLLATQHLDFAALNITTALLLGVTLVCLLVIFGALEWGKKEKASDVFYKMASGKEVPMLQWVYLSLLVLTSLLVSALGGALIGDAQTNQSKTIASDETQSIQKVKKDHQIRLQQLANTIAELEKLSVNPQLRRWGLTKTEQENLRAVKAEKAKLEQTQAQQITQVTTKYKQLNRSNHYQRNLGMVIGFSVVLFMELLMVYAYYFHNEFMKRVEVEGKQHKVLPFSAVTSPEPFPDEVTNTMIQGLQTVFNELLNASSPAKTNSNQRQEISLRPRGKPDPANGQVGREGAYDSYTSHDSLMEDGTMSKNSLGMNENTTATNKSSLGMNKDATGMNERSQGMNKGVKSKDSHDSYTSHDSLTEGGTMNKSSLGMNKGVKLKDNHDSYTSHDSLTEGSTMNKSSLGMNENTTATNKSSLGMNKDATGMNERSQGMNKGVKSKDSHDSYTSHDSLTEGDTMNKSSLGMNKRTSTTNKGGKAKNSQDSLAGVKSRSKKTGHNGYYIPPVCFNHYYEGRDRDDGPYRKLRWYEAVLPDLMQGMKYTDILQKQYKVYDFRQDRYVVKNISDTTLRSTIVAQLKTLENVS